MDILINKGRNPSKDIYLNYLARVDNIYIADNHLAAFWCWCQELEVMKTYSLLHIDRHHDMDPLFAKEGFHAYKSQDFKLMNISELLQLKINEHQMLRWDNFIELYNVFHPFTMPHLQFVGEQSLPSKIRHLKQPTLKQWIKKPLSVSEQVELIHPGEVRRVIDLDIDVFFKTLPDGSYKEVLTPTELSLFAEKIKPFIKCSAVTTIALSPECCGGWDLSLIHI